MTNIHLRGKKFLRVFVLSSLSLSVCHPAKCQDYKPGDPIKFGSVHRPLNINSNTTTPTTYTAAPAYSSPAAPSFAAPDARSLSPVTSPTSYNPVTASPPSTIGGGGYTAPPATSYGALPPGELPPAPGSAVMGQNRPMPYGTPASGQSFGQPQGSQSANKHQHTSKPPRQAKAAGNNQQAAPSGGGGDNMITGFWKAMAQPFKWAAGIFK